MFNIGDTVRCINSTGLDSITSGRIYTIVYTCGNFIHIIDDSGLKGGYRKGRFDLATKETEDNTMDNFHYTMHIHGIGDIDPMRFLTDIGDSDVVLLDMEGQQYAWISMRLRHKYEVLNYKFLEDYYDDGLFIKFGDSLSDRSAFMKSMRKLKDAQWPNKALETMVTLVKW